MSTFALRFNKNCEMKRPNPNEAFPNPNLPRLCFIKNVVKNPRIIIGDYSYYDDVDGADQFEKLLRLYRRRSHYWNKLGGGKGYSSLCYCCWESLSSCQETLR